jgi:hypothetical protein
LAEFFFGLFLCQTALPLEGLAFRELLKPPWGLPLPLLPALGLGGADLKF